MTAVLLTKFPYPGCTRVGADAWIGGFFRGGFTVGEGAGAIAAPVKGYNQRQWCIFFASYGQSAVCPIVQNLSL